jgi:glucose/mannose transport system substrate-binding protein
MSVLAARVKSGQAPTAAPLTPPQIRHWGHQGLLANLDAVAGKEHWDTLLPHAIADSLKVGGHYVAAPVGIHRANWLYVNVAVFEKAGAKVPATFDELFDAADRIKKTGVIPFAWSGQPWQDAIVFESVVLGVGGPAFYDKVFVQQDQAALASPTMLKAWETMGRIRGYLDKYNVDRTWKLATSMIDHGKGDMQFMDDRAAAELLAKGKAPGKDFACVPAPGTQASFVYSVDALAMFTVTGADKQEGQRILADTIMSPDFQEAANLGKGSIPARVGAPRAKFDSCAGRAMDDLAASAKANQLVPSIVVAMDAEKADAVRAVVAKFMQARGMKAEDAMRELAAGLKPR